MNKLIAFFDGLESGLGWIIKALLTVMVIVFVLRGCLCLIP